MAEKLCTLRTKGGGGGAKYTETSLWTNPSSTSDFAAQTVNLSDSIDNYKYIAIDYCFNKNNTGITNRAIYKVDDFKKALKDNNTNHNTIGINIEDSSNYGHSRAVFYVSSTSVAFSLGYRLGASSSSNAAIIIPLEILGLNELAHGTVQTATGTCERGASPVTVNLGFRPSFVSLYKTNASSSSTSAGDSLFVADTGFSTSYVLSAYKESSGSTFTKVAMNNYITITDTGFTFTSSSSSTFRGTYRYVAIGSTTE